MTNPESQINPQSQCQITKAPHPVPLPAGEGAKRDFWWFEGDPPGHENLQRLKGLTKSYSKGSRGLGLKWLGALHLNPRILESGSDEARATLQILEQTEHYKIGKWGTDKWVESTYHFFPIFFPFWRKNSPLTLHKQGWYLVRVSTPGDSPNFGRRMGNLLKGQK